MRSQFVLDDETAALLEELAAARAGNRSFVVREAIRLYANLEDWLDTVEADAGLQQMMAGSRADIEAGRVMNTRQLLRSRATTRSSHGPLRRRAAQPSELKSGARTRKTRDTR